MATLNFLLRVAASGIAFAALLSPAFAEGWESTLTPLTPGALPELRPGKAEYKFGWNGVTAATAELRFSKTAEGHFRLETTGSTTGLARSLWRYDVKNSSTSDAVTLRPIQVHEVETTRKRTLETEVKFTAENVTTRREERRGEEVKSKVRSLDLPNVLSVNSAMLFLRALPLTDGAVERIVVYPTGAPYLCTATVLNREHINLPTGSTDAIKLDVKLQKIGKNRELLPHKKFKRAAVWLSNDSDRLVLRIEAQVFVGTVFAELQSVQFENGKP